LSQGLHLYFWNILDSFWGELEEQLINHQTNIFLLPQIQDSNQGVFALEAGTMTSVRHATRAPCRKLGLVRTFKSTSLYILVSTSTFRAYF
jgi:hypothetical protein